MAKRSPLTTTIRHSFLAGLGKTYHGFGVRSDRYLAHIQRVHGLPIRSFDDMFYLRLDMVDSLARQTIAASKKLALIEGAGAGIGGLVTVLPDMSLLALIAMRMLQKLSLIYGFDYVTEEEQVELWLAAATAAGVELGRDILRKQILEKVVQRVMEKVATRVSAEASEKLAARAIPIISGASGAVINYYFIHTWGNRAQIHFRERHLLRRQMHATGSPRFPSKPLLPS